MNHVNQPDALSIDQLVLEQWILPVRYPEGYELLLIQAGEGYHLANENRFSYKKGDVFVLGPNDRYRFQISEQTRLLKLSFSLTYLIDLMASGSYVWGYADWATAGTGTLTSDPAEQGKLQALLAVLLSEQNSLHSLIGNPIANSLMQTVFSLIDRLYEQRLTDSSSHTYSSELIRRLIVYIRQHIGEPDRLRMNHIADTFNYSPGHLSSLFKQQVGDSIQQFIVRFKLKQVAARLQHTSLTISQIADEFGFADVCHLNKLFKRHYNHTPTAYRQSISA